MHAFTLLLYFIFLLFFTFSYDYLGPARFLMYTFSQFAPIDSKFQPSYKPFALVLFVSYGNRTLVACIGNGNKNGCPYSRVRFFLLWEDLDLRFVRNLPSFVEKWESIDWFSQRLRFTCIPERSCSERDTCTSKMIDQFINFIIRPPRLGTKLMVYSFIWLNLNYTILFSNFKWEGLNHVSRIIRLRFSLFMIFCVINSCK